MLISHSSVFYKQSKQWQKCPDLVLVLLVSAVAAIVPAAGAVGAGLVEGAGAAGHRLSPGVHLAAQLIDLGCR